MKYRKKPVEIEAVRWMGNNILEIKNFVKGTTCDFGHNDGSFKIRTLEGNMVASAGDYIIRGVNGEYYPCKPDIFEKTYEKV